MHKKRVVVGLSGGVDSSVSAYLLKEQGYEVIGIFMRNWHDESVTINNECPWIDDSNDAMLSAQHLGIPFQVLDLSEDYKKRIVDYMFDAYERGITPNPDVLCNREIKFDIFLKAAFKLNADYVATGHYCRKEETEVNGKMLYRLLTGKDQNKDQSYFLCQLNQQQLEKALFPIGHLRKSEVRAIAEKIGLPTAQKKDSQGLCFIGKIKLPDFLQQQLKPKTGKVIEILQNATVYKEEIEIITNKNVAQAAQKVDYSQVKGKWAGEHRGAHYFTVGQRKGLQIGGKKEPLFVIDTNTQTNIVYVGMGEDHPGLYKKVIAIGNKDVHWVRPDMKLKIGESMRYHCRIRYRQPLEPCTLMQEENALYLIFDRKIKAVAPGQFAAWYQDDELIGSGVIQ
jgi:tRNA-specific 2-thiouridylase